MSTEEPKFTLAAKDGAFELRDYAQTIIAEVTVTGDQQEAGRKGFRLLAGYIFGGNRSRAKIAMTVPVSKTLSGATVQESPISGQKIAMTAPVTQTAGSGEWKVRFTMPRAYALADLPVPIDPAVTLKAQPAARQAVLRFSGLAGEARVADATTRLLGILRARGLVPLGPASVARYNPPWTPWFLRRNEVMVPVAGG
ncbi:MAG: heme-binding protein [Alphaproteobacteria bacterium PA3]|nr:MAG: heme-binding protein [Alphaproteobacteria bacterium PA3]